MSGERGAGAGDASGTGTVCVRRGKAGLDGEEGGAEEATRRGYATAVFRVYARLARGDAKVRPRTADEPFHTCASGQGAAGVV